MTEPEVSNDAATLTTSSSPDLQVPYGQFTFNVEGNDDPGSIWFTRKPHLPPDSKSGVTIGKGYDVGSRKPYEVLLHLMSAECDHKFIKEMMRAANKKGSYAPNNNPSKPSAAYEHWNASHPVITGKTNGEILQTFLITRKQQKALFEITYAKYEADVIRWLYTERSTTTPFMNGMICWKNLDPRIQIILIDFMYRGDFFGKKQTAYSKFLKIKQAIMKNCNLNSSESERNQGFEDFKTEVSNRSIWPENLPKNRFEERIAFLTRNSADQNYNRVLSYNWDFTYQAEKRPDLDRAYVPETMENRSGIIMGRGFNLRTRHCYKARLLYFRSHSFPTVSATREEITRKDLEVKKAFEAIGLPANKIAHILEGKRKFGPKAKNFLAETPRAFPTLDETQQKKLFDLTIACYESDVILTCSKTNIIQTLNGHSAWTDTQVLNLDLATVSLSYKSFSWARVNPRIKAILVDLSFTGDWHELSRAFLLKHVANNDLDKFRAAVADPDNWKAPSFPWNNRTSARTAIPPTPDMLETRFEQRRRYLAPELLGPIENASDGSHDLRSLTKLVPCAICKPIGTSNKEKLENGRPVSKMFKDNSNENVIDLGATGRLIPELIQLDWLYTKPWKVRGDIEPYPGDPNSRDDPPDDPAEPTFPPEEPYDPEEGNSLEDIFTPIADISCTITPQVSSQKITNKIHLNFENPTSVGKIGQGYILRYQDKEQSFHYIFIISKLPQGNASIVKVTLSETIDFDDLQTPSVNFDHFHDLEGPHLEFGHLTGDDFDLQDLFFPLPDVLCKMVAADGSSTTTDQVKFEELDNIGDLAEGFKVRYRLKDEELYKYVRISKVLGGGIFKLSDAVNLAELTADKIQFDIPFFMPLNKMGLGPLLGELLPSIDSVISSPQEMLANIKEYIRIQKGDDGGISGISIPINLKIYIPKAGKENASEKQPLSLYFNLRFKKADGRWLLDKDELGRFYLKLPHKEKEQIIDFGIFSLIIPKRPVPPIKKDKKEEPLTKAESDIYFDLTKREFGFTFGSIDAEEKKNLKLYFPGGLTEELKNLDEAKQKRFLFELEKFDPDNFEKPKEENEVYFRLNSEGLSIKAIVSPEEVIVEKKDDAKLVGNILKEIKFKPLKKSKEVSSQIVIVNNTIKEASVFAKMLLPGFKNLEALVSATLKQEKPGEMPVVEASLELENNNGSALAELDLKMLQMSIDSIGLKLKWSEEKKWDFDAYVDGKISLTSMANILEDLEDLKKGSAIQVKELNLKDLNLPKIGLNLDLEKPVKIEILDGLFGCSIADLKLDWNFDPDQQSLGGTFSCKDTTFKFNQPDSLSVEIETSNLDVRFDGNRFDIALPKTIGVKVKIGDSAEFIGSIGWVEEKGERYFYAEGQVKLEGLDIKALLKFGSLEKDNGEKAINFVLYAETDFEMELFAGIVLKRIGGGVGINNKLEIFNTTPHESEIINKIDEINPGDFDSWEPVTKDGISISIIASAMLASNRGSKKTFNAYVMKLIISLDNNFDLIAAGQLWLASSVGYVEKDENKKNPALKGAMVLSPRESRLGIELRSLKNPAIESSKLLSTILNKMTTRFAFRLTPELVDYHLQEISFKDDLLGAHVEISGNYRFAIYRRAFLVKAGVSIVGRYDKSFRSSIGGFSCKGELLFLAEYGGLFSARGINLYGLIQASLSFDASAFIDIVFRISFKVFGRRFSWSFTIRFSISLPSIHIRFRGGLAISEKGKIGFEGYVGIGISICGYKLEMEPRISYNPNIVGEVRGRVAAFERLLDEALENKKNRKMERFFNFTPSSTLVKLDSSITMTHLHLVETETPVPVWLHYFSAQADSAGATQSVRHCYIPSKEANWFTPFRNPDDLSIQDDVRKIIVGKLSEDFQIEEYKVLERDENSKPIAIEIKLTAQPSNIQIKSPLVILTAEAGLKTLWFTQFISPSERIIKATLQLGQDLPAESPVVPIVGENLGTLFVPKQVFYTPWDYENRAFFFGQLEPDTDDEIKLKELEKAEKMKGLFLETTLDPSASSPELPSEIEVIYDPRLEAESREFMPLKGQLLPEDVWSAQFNEIPTEIDLTETGRDELTMIARYEYMQRLASHHKQHTVSDISEEERQKQSIAQVMKILLDDLNNLNPEHFFEKEGSIKEIAGTKHILGLIYQEDIGADASALLDREESEIYILSPNGELETVSLRAPDKEAHNEESLKKRITPLKVRQDFVLSETQSGEEEEAKIKVSLPLMYDLTLFETGEYNQIGHFEIYRNAEEFPISQYAQPNFWTYRDEKEVSRGTVTLGSNAPKLTLENLDKVSLKKASENYHILISFEEAKSKKCKRHFVQGFYQKESLSLVGDLSQLKGTYTYTVKIVHKKTQLVIEPIVLVDEIRVLDRNLLFPTPALDYSLKIIPSGNQMASSQTLQWGRENLHVPIKESIPDDLCLALPLKTLLKDLDSLSKGHFHILEGQERKNWEKSTTNFEIWAQETPMKKTGFYAGEGNIQKSENQRTPSLKKLTHEKRFESLDGKQKVFLKETGDGYKIVNLDLFRFDCSYQFFIRLTNDKSKKLYPMQHLILKDTPKDLEQKPKAKIVEHIEWIENAVYESVIHKESKLLATDLFYAKEDYLSHEGNFIHTNFEQADINLGGVEIFFVDQDEPGYTQRQECEILEESVFKTEQKDFRVPSKWKMPKWQINQTKNFISQNDRSIWHSNAASLDKYYFKENSLLIKDLVDSTQSLIVALTVGSYDWKNGMYPKANLFLKELARFENSPMNVQHQVQMEYINSIKHHLTHLLLGAQKEKELSKILEELGAIESSMSQDDDHLQSDEEKLDDLFVFSFDNDFARRLMGIIQRRLAITQDLFYLIEADDLPDASGADQTHEDNTHLPSLHRWNRILDEYEIALTEIKSRLSEKPTLFKLYKNTEKLKNLFSLENAEENKAELLKALASLKGQFEDPTPSEGSYIMAISKIVPLGNKMTAILDQVSENNHLLKRMHHSVIVDDTIESTDKSKLKLVHTPQRINFTHFMPDSLGVINARKSKIDIQSLSESTDTLFAAFFNLIEYLGFAVDLTLVNDLNQVETQENILQTLKSSISDVENIEDHQIFFLRGIAPNTIREQEEYDSYAFVKLAVIPKNLFKRERKHQDLQPLEINRNQIVIAKPDWETGNSFFACHIQDPNAGGVKHQLHLILKKEVLENERLLLTLDVDELVYSDPTQVRIDIYEYKADRLHEFLNYRNIDLAPVEPEEGEEPLPDPRPYYEKYFSLLGFQLDKLSASYSENQIPEIFLETSSRRWFTLPAKANFSRSTWKLPDRFGHRYQVAIRNISRYEPLINWQISRYTPFELPTYSQLSEYLKLVRIKPVEYGVKRRNEEQMLLSYSYPHPSKALFSYQLPPDAARSIKNQIASVRTGYKGCDMVFYHELVNHDQRKIVKILNQMIPHSEPIHQRVDNYRADIIRKFFEPQIRLFDHERLVTLKHLPYFYKYFFNIRALYNSHLLPKGAPNSHRNKMFTSAALQPTNLYTFRPQIKQRSTEEHFIYDFTLYLSRHIDNLTGRELAKEPCSLAIDSTQRDSSGVHTFQTRDLPDLACVYNVYWKLDPERGSSYHIPIISLHMPWSEEHRPKADQQDQIYLPRLKDTHDKFNIITVGSSGEPVSEDHSKEWKAPLEFKTIDSSVSAELQAEKDYFNSLVEKEGDISDYVPPDRFYAYKTCFSVKIAKKESEALGMYHDPSKFVLQVTRKGALATQLDFEPLEMITR